VRALFYEEFGRYPEDVYVLLAPSLSPCSCSHGTLPRFEQFDPKPIAAASLAQVHYARMKGGQEVAVKVQYPNLQEDLRGDLRTMTIIVQVAKWVRGFFSVVLFIAVVVHDVICFISCLLLGPAAVSRVQVYVVGARESYQLAFRTRYVLNSAPCLLTVNC